MVCQDCYLKELPFFNTPNILEGNIPTNEVIQSDVHSKALVIHKNHLSTAYLFDYTVHEFDI